MATDPYSILGVKKAAPMTEVRKAYRKLAKEFHPDRNPNNKAAEEKFKKIAAAFTFLDDDDRKGKYDRGEIDADGNPAFAGFGAGGFSGARGGDPFGAGFDPFAAGGPFAGMKTGRAGAKGGFGNPEFEDFFGDLFGSGLRSGMKGTSRPAGKGADINTNLEIETLDAISGAKKRVSIAGSQVEIVIPSGVEEGQTLRVRGKGGIGANGAPNGDLLVKIKIRPDKNYRIDGLDVYSDLHISLLEALTGAIIEFQTPLGKVALTIRPNANSGQLLRLKGRGIAKGDKIGDFYVRLMISLPDGDNSDLAEILQNWSKREIKPLKRY